MLDIKKFFNESQIQSLNEAHQLIQEILEPTPVKAIIDEEHLKLLEGNYGHKSINFRLALKEPSPLVLIKDIFYSEDLQALIKEATKSVDLNLIFNGGQYNSSLCVVYFENK